MEFYMRFFSLLVVLVLSVNLSVQSEEVKAPATITILNDEIKNKLCVQLKKYFVKSGYDLKIGVGEFTSTPGLDANYSNGLKKAITDELKNIGFKVDRDADYYLDGKYSKIPSSDKSFSVKLNFTLIHSSNDEVLSQFPITINDYVDVPTITGTTPGLGNADFVNDKSLINNNQKCCTDNYHVKKNFLFFRKRNTSNLILNSNNIILPSGSGGYAGGSYRNPGYMYDRNSGNHMFGD